MKRLTIGESLRDIFIQHNEVNPTLAHQQLRATPGYRGSYSHILKFFYCLRQLGLIEFAYETESATPINKRYYSIVPGYEIDSRWHQPMVELYPSTSKGGLNYILGSSQGRRKEYETRVPTAQ